MAAADHLLLLNTSPAYLLPALPMLVAARRWKPKPPPYYSPLESHSLWAGDGAFPGQGGRSWNRHSTMYMPRSSVYAGEGRWQELPGCLSTIRKGHIDNLLVPMSEWRLFAPTPPPKAPPADYTHESCRGATPKQNAASKRHAGTLRPRKS